MLALAKINLFLHIQNKRDDGYHNLESLVCFLDFGDELSFKKSAKFSLNITGLEGKSLIEQCGDSRDNIIIKSASYIKNYIANKYDIKPDTLSEYEVSLQKNIPVGAGIGGGSSDGAATILSLIELWQNEGAFQNIINKNVIISALTNEHASDLAQKLGADLPICLAKKPAIISGIGDEISIINNQLPAMFFVLVNPNISLSTARIFGKFASNNFTNYSFNQSDVLGMNCKSFCDYLSTNTDNNLSDIAKNIVPEISDILQLLSAQDGCLLSRMSGSGATCFGVFADEQFAKAATKNILLNNQKHWVKTAKTLE